MGSMDGTEKTRSRNFTSENSHVYGNRYGTKIARIAKHVCWDVRNQTAAGWVYFEHFSVPLTPFIVHARTRDNPQSSVETRLQRTTVRVSGTISQAQLTEGVVGNPVATVSTTIPVSRHLPVIYRVRDVQMYRTWKEKSFIVNFIDTARCSLPMENKNSRGRT